MVYLRQKTFLNILNLSSELKTLCKFSKIPHESQFSRFKCDFITHIVHFFNTLVDITEPICRQLNSALSKIIIADTTDIEAYANPEIKLSYINGHFCYALKATTLVNGLGIIRHIDFNDTQVMDFENNITAEIAKDDYDSKTLIPIMRRFFNIHKNFNYNYFLGDSAYDCDDNYKSLIKDCSLVPIICPNTRNSSDLPQPSGFTSDGIPLCPKDSNLPMKFDGITREKGRLMRVKWICPKSKKIEINGETTYNLTCENPCTPSPCGIIYHP